VPFKKVVGQRIGRKMFHWQKAGAKMSDLEVFSVVGSASRKKGKLALAIGAHDQICKYNKIKGGVVRGLTVRVGILNFFGA